MKRLDRGSVVAETAMVLPTLLLITTLLMTGLSAINTKFKCEQLAASIARAIERDEPQWIEMAKQSWPEAEVHVESRDQWVAVEVSKSAAFEFKVQGRAVALQRS